jgi:hypothetical protein
MTGVLIGDLTVSAADLSMSATQFVTQGRTLISTPRSAIASTTQKQLTTLAGRGEDDEYRGRKVQGGVGWTRLIAGGRKRRAAAVAAGPGRGSRGRGTSSGAAGDGDGRGLDDCVADAPPSRFGEGGLSSRPLSIVAYP